MEQGRNWGEYIRKLNKLKGVDKKIEDGYKEKEYGVFQCEVAIHYC
jgi:hypothetical protein